MNGATRTWAVVLAAGEGTRLASLTSVWTFSMAPSWQARMFPIDNA
jgi:hypothetical protein